MTPFVERSLIKIKMVPNCFQFRRIDEKSDKKQ